MCQCFGPMEGADWFCPITVSSLTAVIVHDDVQHMMSLSASTVDNGLGLHSACLFRAIAKQTICKYSSASVFKTCKVFVKFFLILLMRCYVYVYEAQ